MFYSLTGNIIHSDSSFVALECSGVGFRCQTSRNTLAEISGEKTATLFTFLNVREDALELFGFSTEYELEWFKLLLSVKGIGPKAALAILSELVPDRLALSISAGDSKAIARAQGVGPKTAQRVILELKDKVKSAVSLSGRDTSGTDAAASVAERSNLSEAVAALTMLGYGQTEAAQAAGALDPSLSTEEIIRQCLKKLSRQV